MARHRHRHPAPSHSLFRWTLLVLLSVFVGIMVFVEIGRSKHEHEHERERKQPQPQPQLQPQLQKRASSETKPASKSPEEAPCPVGWRLESDIGQCTRNTGGILDEMVDASADPCENPYRHACGRFIDDPRNQGENLLFYSLYQRNREIMQDIVLRHASEKLGDVALFFHSCADFIERGGPSDSPTLARLHAQVAEMASFRDLPRVMGALAAYDVPLPIALSMEVNPLRGSSLIPLLSQHLGVLANSESELDEVGTLADIQRVARCSLKEARQAVALQRTLLGIRDQVPPTTAFHDYAVSRYNQTHLVRNWRQFANAMAGKGFDVEAMLREAWPSAADLIQQAWVYAPSYMYRFAELHRTYSLDTWKVYLRYAVHVSLERGPRTSPERHYAYHRSYDGRWAFPWNRPHRFFMVAPEEQESPEQQCVYATEAYLPLLLDDYYLHGALDQRRTQVAQTIVEGVIGTYRDLLRNDSDGLFSPHLPRDVALDKLEHAQVILGAPSHWKELMQFQDRPRVGEDFLENVLRIRGYHKRHLEALFAERPYQPLEAERLFDGLLHVDNAFYMHQLNAIVINAGILQEPLFSPDGEPEVQYGRLGVVVAHELSHAFDRTGTHFDRLGSVVDPAWMDGAAFERDTHYLVDLYTRHSYLRNLNDGQRTLDENIADQYGLHVAWRALLRAKPDASFERFRLAFAQIYCDAVDRGVERKLAQRASHSINSVRVNAGLSTFSCPLGVH